MWFELLIIFTQYTLFLYLLWVRIILNFLIFSQIYVKQPIRFFKFYPRSFFLFELGGDFLGFVWPTKTHTFNFFSKRFLRPYRRRRFLFRRKRRSLKRRLLRLHKTLECTPMNAVQTFSQIFLSNQNTVFTSFFFSTFNFLKTSYYQYHKTRSSQKLPIIYQFAFQMFLKSFFQQHIRLRFVDTTSIWTSNFLQLSLRFFQHELRGKNRFLYLIEVVDILLVSLHQKNAPLFLWWLKKTFESWDFKRFNLLFLLLKVVLGYSELHILKLFFLRGIFIKFKGKLQKGASRKRKRIFQFGTISLTSKNLRISAACCQIRTLSGSIGCNLRIFY